MELLTLPKEKPTEGCTALDEFVAELQPDETGPALSKSVAGAVNLVWRKPAGSDTFKEAAKRHKRPSNVELFRVSLDEEVASA